MLYPGAAAPPLAERAHRLLELVPGALAPWPLIRRLLFHLRSAQEERDRPLRIARREEYRHRATLRPAEQRGPLASGSVHHRPR